MTTSEKLLIRLREEFEDFSENIPLTEKPRRLYHGRNQRATGAWSWAVGGTKNCRDCYGSQWSMNDMLKSPFISLFVEPGGDISILPEKSNNE